MKRHKRGRKGREFHDALFSLGLNDRTGRLSNSELMSQIVREAGVLFGMSCRSLATIIRVVAGAFAKSQPEDQWQPPERGRPRKW